MLRIGGHGQTVLVHVVAKEENRQAFAEDAGPRLDAVVGWVACAALVPGVSNQPDSLQDVGGSHVILSV